MDFDSVLPEVGSFGLYQKLVICLVLLPAILPCAFHAYSQLFIAARAEHWCRVPELEPFIHDYPDIVKNLSIPLEKHYDGYKYSECTMFQRNYTNIASVLLNDQNTSNKLLKKIKLFDNSDAKIITERCLHGWNYDTSIFTSTVVTEWNLVCDRDYYATLALVLFGCGGLIGNYIFGYIHDSWGRKPSFYIYLFLEIFSCVLSAIAWNFYAWLILRVIVGLTVPAILSSPYVLAIELVGPRHRVFCTIVTNIAYSIGLVLLSGIVFMVRDWRYLSLAVSLPLLLLFTCFFILPESPRWLVATGKYNRAAKIMKTIARLNGKLISDNYEAELKIKFHRLDGIECNTGRNYGIKDLFATKNMTKKTLIITFIWFATTSVYVGLSYYAPALGGNEIWNFFLAGAVEFPTYLFLWPCLNFLGRRWILCISMITGGVACLATFFTQQSPLIMLILYCIGKMGISSAFVVLPLAASEIYPTVVRGLGMSFSSVIGMIGPILIPIINYMGGEIIVLPLIVMGVLLTIGGFISLFLPETKDKPLPQTIEDAEMIRLTRFFTFNCKSNDNSKKTAINSNICSVCKIEMKSEF